MIRFPLGGQSGSVGQQRQRENPRLLLSISLGLVRAVQSTIIGRSSSISTTLNCASALCCSPLLSWFQLIQIRFVFSRSSRRLIPLQELTINWNPLAAPPDDNKKSQSLLFFFYLLSLLQDNSSSSSSSSSWSVDPSFTPSNNFFFSDSFSVANSFGRLRRPANL